MGTVKKLQFSASSGSPSGSITERWIISMIYFKFDSDETVSTSKIIEIFCDKLYQDFNLGVSIDLMCDGIDIPLGSYSIDDELDQSYSAIIKYILLEYTKIPLRELDGKSLQDFGIQVRICKEKSKAEVNALLQRYLQDTGSFFVTEDVLWKNLKPDEKVQKISKYFEKIKSKDKELIIIDPYFLYDENDEYCNMVALLIDRSCANKVLIVTDKRNCKKKCLSKIESKVHVSISNKYSDDFHDRFWISDRKNGFCMGTSLNGIGKRISIINMLSSEDLAEIVKELRRQKIL